MLLQVAAMLAAALVAACTRATETEPPPSGPRAQTLADRVVVTNADGEWTIYTRCVRGRGFTVGPGYVARLVARGREVLVDDRRRPGTLNDPEFGGLGAFGWHHARGRPGRLRFGHENSWEVSGRSCARANGGFGVAASRLSEAPVYGADADGAPYVEFGITVVFSDSYTYPRPLLRARYRYRVYDSVVKSWVALTQLCPGGRCGRTSKLAFVKEPKLVAHVAGTGGYTRMATFLDDGRLACIYLSGGGVRGPILDTGQCEHDDRARLRFDFGSERSGAEGGCLDRPCLNVVMRGYPVTEDGDVEPGRPTLPWEAGLGLDGWARVAAARPAAFGRDTASIDGVQWSCHSHRPSAQTLRRWETTGRLDEQGDYRSLGGLFPGWEGGRGGYDCEPLARAFGPGGESWGVFASYSVGPGWEELR